jgi:glutaredoxin|tara:strand:+ start:131 stop:412 length:282 start_codon:yes stop_codon:yes gene_type:complete
MSDNYFHVFAKKRCKHCSNAVKLLNEQKTEYTVTYCDKAPTALKNLKTTCEWSTVPIIFEMAGDAEVFIGGYTELKRRFDKSKQKGRGEGTDG